MIIRVKKKIYSHDSWFCLALKNLDSKTQGYVKKNDINKANATLQLHDSRLIKTSNC